MRKTIVISLLFGLIAFWSALSVNAAPNTTTKKMVLTLDDAIMLALRHNPDYISEKLTRVVQKYSLVVARNEFEPQFKLEGNANYNHSFADNLITKTYTAGATGEINLKNKFGTVFTFTNTNPVNNTGYSPTVALQIEQPLLRGFGPAIVEQALNDAIDTEKINQLKFKNTTMDLIAGITTKYLTLYQSQQELLIDQQTLKNYQQTLKNNKIKIKSGSMAKSAILQNQADIASEKVTIENDKNQIMSNKLTLLKSLGLKLDAQIHLPKKIFLDKVIKQLLLNKNQPLPLYKCQHLALTNNIDYQVGAFAISEASRTLIAAKDALKWKLDLTANHTWGGNIGGWSKIARTRDNNLGIKFDIPIDDIKSKQGYLTARIGLRQANIAYQDEGRQLKINVLDDRHSVISKQRQIILAKQAVILQQKTVNVAAIKQNAGLITNFELSQQQQDLQTAQQQLISTIIDYIYSLQNLDERLGVLLDAWKIKPRDQITL